MTKHSRIENHDLRLGDAGGPRCRRPTSEEVENDREGDYRGGVDFFAREDNALALTTRWAFALTSTDHRANAVMAGVDTSPQRPREAYDALGPDERALLGEHLDIDALIGDRAEPEPNRNLRRHPDGVHHYEPPAGGFGPCVRCGGERAHERHVSPSTQG